MESLTGTRTLQMVVQGQWQDQSPFNQLPHFDTAQQHAAMVQQGYSRLPELLAASQANRTAALSKGSRTFLFARCLRLPTAFRAAFGGRKDRVNAALAACDRLPVVDMKCSRKGRHLEVHVRRVNRVTAGGNAYAPMFPKQKREGWWLVAGADDGEVKMSAYRRNALADVARSSCWR